MRPIHVLLLFLFAFASCSKHPLQPAPPSPYIYIGGSVGNQAAYWKFQLPLDSAVGTPVSGGTVITNISLSDTDVYMAGPSNGAGLYWKNGVSSVLPGAFQTSAIVASGSVVYAVGVDLTSGVGYWTNGTEMPVLNTLPNVTLSCTLNNIAVSAGNVYVNGTVSYAFGADTSYWGNSAVYWENGQPVFLSSHGYGGVYYQSTSGIALSGSDVYISGNIDIDADTLSWCGYWKNGDQVTLFNSVGHTYAQAAAIAVSDTNVYVSGAYIDNGVGSAVYWKNGALNFLPGGTDAYSIAVYGSDVYALGSSAAGNTVLWKNGVAVATFPSGSVGYCLVVGN